MLGYILDGGWMMLPLLICSISLVAVIVDRMRAFRCASKIDPEKIRAEVREATAAGDVDKAIAACEASEGPVAAVLLTGLYRLKVLRGKNKSETDVEAGVTKAMEDYAPKSMNGLEKRLGAMVLIASVSPLLGMCGTVTGMINSFSVMAGAAGLDPGAVAGGIAEALITTAAGLLIAIPGVVAYNLFQKKIEDWNLQIEGAITEFINAMG